MVVAFVIFKHSRNLSGRKAHIDEKIRSNVPGTVILVCLVRTELMTDVSDIVNTGKNHRLEGRFYISVHVIAPKLCKEIHKYRVICSTVNFVNHQDNWSVRCAAPLA